MKYAFIIMLFLTACAGVPDPMESAIQKSAAERISHFNQLRGTNLEVPTISFANMDGVDGHTDAFGIIIDTSSCEKDFDDCINDTLPHELGHWAVANLSGNQSISVSHFGNKTTFTHGESAFQHDTVWCDAMRAMGGVPEKHGYCR